MVGVFLAFAFAYFLSTLMRAITATLSPALTQELALSAQDLGLLAGGYFLGFSATQLPLGKWLDLVLFGGGSIGLHLFCDGREFCGFVVGAGAVWRGCQCLLDGALNWLSTLDGSGVSASCQFLDAHDGLTWHALFNFASSVADAHHRMARHFCRFGRLGGGGHDDDLLGGPRLGEAPRNIRKAN